MSETRDSDDPAGSNGYNDLLHAARRNVRVGPTQLIDAIFATDLVNPKLPAASCPRERPAFAENGHRTVFGCVCLGPNDRRLRRHKWHGHGKQ